MAEVRVAQPAYGSPRSASLQPRRPGRYLSRLTWALVPATATVSLLAGAAVVLFLVLNQLGAIHPVTIRDSTIALVDNGGFFVVAALGVLVATTAWPPRRGSVPDPAPIGGT